MSWAEKGLHTGQFARSNLKRTSGPAIKTASNYTAPRKMVSSWDAGDKPIGRFVLPSWNRIFEPDTEKDRKFTNMSQKSPPSRDA